MYIYNLRPVNIRLATVAPVLVAFPGGGIYTGGDSRWRVVHTEGLGSEELGSWRRCRETKRGVVEWLSVAVIPVRTVVGVKEG